MCVAQRGGPPHRIRTSGTHMRTWACARMHCASRGRGSYMSPNGRWMSPERSVASELANVGR
eukprot:12615902-Alexandrium_andersonii.AAC.1